MSYSFNQHNRCPVCGGFAGAYKEEKRCRGFRHRDGGGVFCEQPQEDKKPKNFSGYDLWWYET